MQADKLEQGHTGALSDFVVNTGSSSRDDDRENGDRHRRRRSRSPREDERDRKSSRRMEDDSASRSSSRRYDDDERERRRRDRDRDSRDYRDNRGDRRDRDYDRRDRGEYDRYDRRGGGSDRRDRDRDSGRDYHRDDRRDSRGAGGGGRRDNYSRNDDDRGRGQNKGVEVFGAGNANRSPTPEGTIPISKRKRVRTGWDTQAPGFENFTAMQAKMTGIFNLPGQVRPMTTYSAMAPNAQLPELHLGGGNDLAPVNQAGAAYARQARRLYVGNITYEASEMSVAQFFNSQMRERGWANDSDPAGVQGPDPVVSVQVNHEKSYAFVEFRSASEASAAMGFDGIVFNAQVLKIRRPKDYVGNEHSATTHIPGVVSTNVPDTPNKIFIGGLPSYLNDVQVMELLQTFGELRAFNLVKEGSTNNSKGFAFCEYVDPSITDIACQGLNGMELGDRYLVVQRAAIGANAAKSGSYNGSGGADAGMSADLTKLAPNILSAAEEAQPTRVLQMLNMVTMDDLVDDQDFEDLVEDIKEECSKYGSVIDVKIPRPIKTESGKVDQKASEALEDLMKVFVMFDNTDDTKKAMMSIAGRKFGGRSVICAYADEEKMV